MRCCGGEQSTACGERLRRGRTRWGLLCVGGGQPCRSCCVGQLEIGIDSRNASFSDWESDGVFVHCCPQVPNSVVCLLGVDREGEPNTLGNPDDLTQSPQCIGDRDQRSEYQAQLLDAVMSAQDRLIICSTGFDVTSGAEVSPRLRSANSSMLLVTLLAEFPLVHHPRQTWSEANFVIHPEVSDRPWSHDRSAVEAAICVAVNINSNLVTGVVSADGPCTVINLRHAFSQPIRTFCEDRLHLAALEEFGRERGSNIPLILDGLDRFGLRHGMLSSATNGGNPEEWVDFLPHQVTFLLVCTEPHPTDSTRRCRGNSWRWHLRE